MSNRLPIITGILLLVICSWLQGCQDSALASNSSDSALANKGRDATQTNKSSDPALANNSGTALASNNSDTAHPNNSTPAPSTDTNRQLDNTPIELQWLLAAYPDHLSHSEEDYLIWKDNSRMLYYEGEGQINDSFRLETPMLADIFWWDYRTDTLLVEREEDPGRIRHQGFFSKMYGESKAEVMENLTVIRWLPSSLNKPLKVTRINGVADSLQAISDELDQIPELRKYLNQPAGTFNYRKIAGTERLSAHSWGIAIDINVKYADYWRWSSEFKADQPLRYRNRIPMQIVQIFEKHGFIWGGRWYHYDTMHFEYRPEFFVPGYKEFLEEVRQKR